MVRLLTAYALVLSEGLREFRLEDGQLDSSLSDFKSVVIDRLSSLIGRQLKILPTFGFP